MPHVWEVVPDPRELAALGTHGILCSSFYFSPCHVSGSPVSAHPSPVREHSSSKFSPCFLFHRHAQTHRGTHSLDCVPHLHPSQPTPASLVSSWCSTWTLHRLSACVPGCWSGHLKCLHVWSEPPPAPWTRSSSRSQFCSHLHELSHQHLLLLVHNISHRFNGF